MKAGVVIVALIVAWLALFALLLWGLMGIALKERGHTDFADRCTKMSRLLQARFDAGDYYRETR